MSETVKIRKKNRVLQVSEGRLAGFLNQGYDQIDEDGNVVKRATGGRTVSLPEYNKVVEELETANAELEALRAIGLGAELETAKKEVESLKEKVKELEATSKKAETPKK